MKAAGLPLLVAGCGLSLAGCLDERPRPAPPQLAIMLSQAQVRSPDTLRGAVRARDPDGIDSVWLTIDIAPAVTWDGLLETEFDAPFQAPISKGHPPYDRIPVKLRARDVAGFKGELDTVVRVIP